MKRNYLLIIILAGCLTSEAQLNDRQFIIESKFQTGLNLPFYKAINYLVNDNIYAADLAVVFPTYGKDLWEKLYNYPKTGVGLSYWTLGNDEVFGRAYALYTFIAIPFLQRSNKFSLSGKFSVGGAYLTKKFDINDNHLNRAVGSHTNIYIQIGLDGRFMIQPGCEILIGGGITHFSNGKTRSPNYGINAGIISLGMNYNFGKTKNEYADPEIPPTDKKLIQSIVYSAGSKVYDNLLGKKFFFSSLTYNIERYVNRTGKAGLGGDFFYDGAISEALAAKDGTLETDISKLLRFGIHASYAVQYKKVTMGIQAGYYLYSKYTDLTLLYDRIFIQYHLTKNILANVSIKSHYGKADFLEWGVGYSW